MLRGVGVKGGSKLKQWCQGKPHQEGDIDESPKELRELAKEITGEVVAKQEPGQRPVWLEQKGPGRASSYPQQHSSRSFSYHAVGVLRLSSHICDCFTYLGVCLFLVCFLTALGSL